MQLREKSAVLDLRDVDPAKGTTHPDYEILAEVVSERALALELVHLDHDRFGLGLADPDWEQPRPTLLLKDHHVGVGGAVETEPHHFDFDELHEIKLTTRTGQRPSTAFRSSATRSSRSHVKSVPFPFFFGARPK